MEKQEKLTMHTANIADANFSALAKMFPNAVTETIDENGEVVRAIDADVLAQEINTHVVSGKEERYQFTWPDKKKSVLLANAPIAATLRPCREESVDFDTTENLYIEGDNLDVLKLLRETYLNRVKMIYIDPPYNTGKDFIYEDDFKEETSEFLKRDGQYDEQGNRLTSNFDSNGRFHTDWLNMMYPRLRIAHDLLSDEGVIFISIDDNEVHNLRKICDEIFGATNFEGHIHWRRRHNQPNDKTKMIGLVAEHIIAYAKNNNYLRSVGVGKIDLTGDFSNPDNDPRGDWASKPWKVGSDQSGSRYTITTPTGIALDEEWMGEEATYRELLADNRIIFPRGGDGMPRKKYFKFEREEEGQCATNWWESTQFGNNQGANDCMTGLFGVKNVFSNPKPVELLRGLLQIGNVKTGDIVLDFFSGSATTAHAVMQLNFERQAAIQFILVQLPENLDDSLVKSSGKTKAQIQVSIDFLDSIRKPHTIAEIGKERIRRAGKKIKEEVGLLAQNLDIGFRVLKLDSSNMKEVYYTPEEYSQMGFNLQGFMDNIKPDRSDEDLLFQVMLDLGIPLSAKISQDGKIFNINDDYLIACFDRVDTSMITEIAQKQPYYAVFRDSSFINDSALVNVEQIFNTYSPSTIRRVL
ncbi:MAG TPA: site-specific DNA-methyltransferase [Fervidobacterium sp.]|nr:site-specific DNA-methyltransferase [Fervidobacterium sp.]HUM43265.1 site-specific DNA-methyltransferase [Fervidobacterium sp.]